MYEEFLKYLMEVPSYKSKRSISSSALKYADAINTISDDMIAADLIKERLYNIVDLKKLDKIIEDIKDNDAFIDKNERGNKMYSNALDHYKYFRYYYL